MIPEWNMSGILPPIRSGEDGSSEDRSPYRVTFDQVMERFASSPERAVILNGLLEYRAALHGLGIVKGFQWLDGSFVEQVEVLESRSPNDVDVVTFFHLPDGLSQRDLLERHQYLFDPEKLKSQYNVHGFPHILGNSLDVGHVRRIAYWYSMWSHRRSMMWKGFVQIDLSPSEDINAKKLLEQIQQQNGERL